MTKMPLFIVIILSLPSSLNAASISYNGYTLNTVTNIVNGGGLEWLQWDETAGQTAQEGLASYQGADWRLASNTEMAALFNSFDFDSSGFYHFDNVENTTDIRHYSWASDEDSASNHFISLFGDTYKAAGIVSDYGELLEGSYAVFGRDINGDGKINRGGVTDDYINLEYIPSPGSAFMFYDDTLFNASPFATYGVALVRTSEVPVPSAFYLFISTLAGLFISKRKCREQV